MEKSNVTTSIYLDKRKKKKDETYPVKLRITFKRKSKFYKTGYSLTKKEFEKLVTSKSPRGELKDVKIELGELEAKARQVISKLPVFSFTMFDRKYYSNYGDSNDLFFLFDEKIVELKMGNQIRTADTYDCAKESIRKFHPKDILELHEIDVLFLKNYEGWMTSNGRSLSTVGIYLRNVRHLMNRAVEEELLSRELYPFGKGKYQIPQPRNVKKALSKSELKALYEYKPAEGSPMHLYRDIWFFSYLCNGMNIKDICLLKIKNIKGAHIYFYRHKTQQTIRNAKPIDVPILSDIQEMIARWGVKDAEADDYLFPFVKKNHTPIEVEAQVNQVTKKVNRYINKIAKDLEIEKRITSYWARHTYATILKRSDVSTEFISEQLGHRDLKTTEDYLDSFEDEAKLEATKKLLQF